MVHPEPGKQTGDINPRRGKDAVELADSAAGELSDNFGAALRLRRKIRRAAFAMRWSSLGWCGLGRNRFNRSDFGSPLWRRLALRGLLLDRDEFHLGKFELAAKHVSFVSQRR
jgi:hypothetical protein